MKKNAFTLLELLIVIGIIGILVALATVSYSATQKAGRDSRRKQDMVAIQNALEQYYSQNSYKYPASECSGALAPTYLKTGFPSDPQLGTPYSFSACVDTGYCICSQMEKNTSGNSGAACNWSATPKEYYCVGNLQ